MSVVIEDRVLHAAHISEEELKQEIAILLFQSGKLSLGQSSEFAAISQFQFQHLLASRRIPPHYDVAEFKEDLETLKKLDAQ